MRIVIALLSYLTPVTYTIIRLVKPLKLKDSIVGMTVVCAAIISRILVYEVVTFVVVVLLRG